MPEPGSPHARIHRHFSFLLLLFLLRQSALHGGMLRLKDLSYSFSGAWQCAAGVKSLRPAGLGFLDWSLFKV
jgi:hypothetical protein